MTPAEAHARLIEVEKERDRLREDLSRPITESRARRTKRVTTVLELKNLIRLHERVSINETASSWIHDAIVQRLDRLDSEQSKSTRSITEKTKRNRKR